MSGVPENNVRSKESPLFADRPQSKSALHARSKRSRCRIDTKCDGAPGRQNRAAVAVGWRRPLGAGLNDSDRSQAEQSGAEREEGGEGEMRFERREGGTRSLEDKSSQNEFPRLLILVSILMDQNQPKNIN